MNIARKVVTREVVTREVVTREVVTSVVAIMIGMGQPSLVQAQPAIYRCADATGVVYSDRPCSAEADPHEIDDSRVTVYTPAPGADRAPAAAPAAPTKAPAKTKRARTGRSADPAKHQAKCARLAQQLRDVRTKMRTGYGAKEGERLKARQRQLNEQRRTQKCG